MRWRRLVLSVAVPLVATVCWGCTASAEPGARAAATAFQRALAQQDGPTACGLLSDEARGRLEGASGRPCAEALLALPLPADDVRSTEVWGDEAQVRLGREVLFLAELKNGWRVTGAGCLPRPDQPYDCRVRA